MTGVEQRITSAYHPQANGLVERQNRTIKNALVKVLSDHQEWPSILEGVLFAHRVTKHNSTKYSPFFMLYNRDPVLPIDLKYKESALGGDEEFDMDMFQEVLKAAKTLRNSIHEKASVNIKNAQARQKRDYDRRHSSGENQVRIDDKVLLWNDRRQDRKGGKLSNRWLGPYVVKNVNAKGVVTVANQNGVTIKKKYNIS